MPANLTPQYLDAEERFKEAQTNPEKLKALRHMMAVIPKHKGTEKIRAELRRKLSRLQDDIREERKRSGGRPSPGHVPHEGAGQIVLVGAPNVGKSSLVAALSHAHPKIAPYPYTTLEPQSGMMDYEDVQVQLVDTPAISAEHMESWMLELIHNADRALLVADLGSDSLLEDVETVVHRLAEHRITFVPVDSEIEPNHGSECIETLVLATQCDRSGSGERLELLRELLGELLTMPLSEGSLLVASTETGEGLDALRKTLYDCLHVVRIYTKMPGHKPDHNKPFVVPHGATVLELARVIHKDIAKSMKFARIWGSGKFDGQTVQHDHVLADRDIIEIHA